MQRNTTKLFRPSKLDYASSLIMFQLLFILHVHSVTLPQRGLLLLDNMYIAVNLLEELYSVKNKAVEQLPARP